MMNQILRSFQNSNTLIWNNLCPVVNKVRFYSTTIKNVPKISYERSLKRYSANVNNKQLCVTNFKPEWYLSVAPTRTIHIGNRKSQVPRTPDLIYFPHITRWLKTKLKFKYLKTAWDPTFSEGAFIYGSTQAVCRITEIINNNNISDLEGLLTKPAKMKLVEDMTRKLTKTQREIIRISPRDIKILVPMSVQLENGIKKQCKISMRVLALKWFSQNTGYLRLVLVALQSEFLKDYTNGINHEWNISGFDVMECTVLTETPYRKF